MANIKKSDGTILATNTYDDKGFRVKKTDSSTTSWYVRDASGNILATYYKDATNPVHLDEVNLFGASRIGMAQANTSGTINKYVYELTDHLGNVRSTIFKDASNALVIESYADYYPFGMVIPTRNQPASKAYRFGYQGQFAEKDEETGLDHFEARDYDKRLGRWLCPDPAGQYHSPYLGMGNNPVSGVDKDGRESDTRIIYSDGSHTDINDGSNAVFYASGTNLNFLGYGYGGYQGSWGTDLPKMFDNGANYINFNTLNSVASYFGISNFSVSQLPGGTMNVDLRHFIPASGLCEADNSEFLLVGGIGKLGLRGFASAYASLTDASLYGGLIVRDVVTTHPIASGIAAGLGKQVISNVLGSGGGNIILGNSQADFMAKFTDTSLSFFKQVLNGK